MREIGYSPELVGTLPGAGGHWVEGGEVLGTEEGRAGCIFGGGSSEGGAGQRPGPEICFFSLKLSNWYVQYRLMPGSLGTLGSSSPLSGQPKSSVASFSRQPFPGLDFTLPLSILPPQITSPALPPNHIPLHKTGLAHFSQGKAGAIGTQWASQTSICC